MEAVRIIGVGSPFGADRLGWEAACYLEQQLPSLYPALELSTELLDRPGAVLLEYLRPGEGMILLIDAVEALAGLPEVASYSLDELVEQPGVSSHGFGVAETLQLGQSIGLLHHDIVVLGIARTATAWPGELLKLVDELLEARGGSA